MEKALVCVMTAIIVAGWIGATIIGGRVVAAEFNGDGWVRGFLDWVLFACGVVVGLGMWGFLTLAALWLIGSAWKDVLR